ncbi:hypothetical protein GCM10020367_26790 [Streptomyces sannanensis]|uniref:MFS transporter n=1 Tax=Streptomyces sannanensis TaxID=285536 RepID=A0ABP6SAP5_9ACTN
MSRSLRPDRCTGKESPRTGEATPAAKSPADDAVPRVDWPGALCVFATGALLLTALVQGGIAWPWLSAPSLALLGAARLFQLPLIVGVQSTVGWAERGTTTSSVLFCRQVGQSVGAALFGAVANGVLAARLASGADLDSAACALDDPAPLGADATEELRHAVAAAVGSVHLGAACAVGLAPLVLLFLAPRRFPVLSEATPDRD